MGYREKEESRGWRGEGNAAPHRIADSPSSDTTQPPIHTTWYHSRLPRNDRTRTSELRAFVLIALDSRTIAVRSVKVRRNSLRARETHRLALGFFTLVACNTRGS